MPNSANVKVGITGGVRTAPVGTTAPTTPTAAYAAGWLELGYISEDGVTENFTTDTTDIKAWQNGVTVRTVISESDVTFQFTVIETTLTAWELFYPGSTFETATGVTTKTVKAPTPNPRAFAIDVVDGSVHYRKIIPRGEVTERGEIVYVNDEPIGYNMTIKCYPDSAGTLYIELSDDPAVEVEE